LKSFHVYIFQKVVMAAILPAINPMGEMNMTQSSSIKQRTMPSPPTQNSSASKRFHIIHTHRKSQGKKEREIEQRRTILRARQPELTKIQTSE